MALGEFTFLHAADLHIDSPLRGLEAYEGAPAERLRLAVREAFHGLVDTAIERRVAFVILAGDLFDGDWPDYESGLWFGSRLGELSRAGIPVFAIRGNHDAESRVTKGLRWPEGAHLFSVKAPQTRVLEELGVALHGQSYAEAATEANLVLDYPAPREGLFNIGVLHTALEGREHHGRYAPCTLGDLRDRGYDYWALGHVHKREVVSEDPWVVFPGNIQGRHVGELGPKGATLVHVADGRVARLEPLECDVARWEHVRVDVSGLAEESALIPAVEDRLRAVVEAADGRLVAARLTLTGESLLDAALRIDEVRWAQELRLVAQGVSDELWIEKIRLETTAPAGAAGVEDGLAGLGARLQLATFDDDELSALTRQLAPLANRLPQEVRDDWNPGDRASLGAALDPARRYLAALLGAAGTRAAGDDADEEDA